MVIGKLNPTNGAFVHLNEFCWDDDEFPQCNDTYAIYLAARNKSEGKEYIDPYKNIPADIAIKDLTNKFGKKLQESIADFLPYDMSQTQHLRTVVKIKHILEQTLKEHYTKQKS
jgi:hypothetical protein